jgi:ribonuclease HII
VLPGSRRSEIKYIAPRLFATCAEMHRARPGCASSFPSCRAARCRRGAARDAAADVPITLVDGRAHEALAACDVAIVASGTATLEAALFKRPMVVVYVMHILSWQIGKLVHYQPWISLPNILLRDHAVPELLQHGATPEKIAAAAFRWLDDPPRCDHCSSASRRCTASCAATPARSPPRRSKPSCNADTHARQDLLSRRQAARHRRRRRPAGGVDEVGRGPLAGPVVAAAVILEEKRTIRGLNDSKLLTAEERERLDREIRKRAVCVSVASASVAEIDSLNILRAALLAMQRAVEGLAQQPQIVLVDGNQRPTLAMPVRTVVGGDARVRAISAASIVAKVYRDASACSCTRSTRSTASTATRAIRLPST